MAVVDGGPLYDPMARLLEDAEREAPGPWLRFHLEARRVLGLLADRVGEQISPDRGVTVSAADFGFGALGGVGAVVRWLAMALDPSFWLLFPLQCLHALTFGATYLGALHLIQGNVSEQQAGTAQSIHAAVASGIITGIATVIAGFLYAGWGAASFGAMAGFAMAGVLVTGYLALDPTMRRPSDD